MFNYHISKLQYTNICSYNLKQWNKTDYNEKGFKPVFYFSIKTKAYRINFTNQLKDFGTLPKLWK